jgi:indole-3-glycerol phosphate synthase
VAAAGVNAVLAGEALMRAEDPASLLAEFAAVPRRAR